MRGAVLVVRTSIGAHLSGGLDGQTWGWGCSSGIPILNSMLHHLTGLPLGPQPPALALSVQSHPRLPAAGVGQTSGTP